MMFRHFYYGTSTVIDAIQTAGVHLTQQGQENGFTNILNYILSPHFFFNKYRDNFFIFLLQFERKEIISKNGMLPLNCIMIISTTLSVIDYILVYVTKAIK